MSEVEWKREYHRDGTLQRETPYVNDQEHGVEKGYYSNGMLEWEQSYIDGQPHGAEKYYHNNGVLRYEALWVRGKQRNDLLGDKHRLKRLMLLGEQG